MSRLVRVMEAFRSGVATSAINGDFTVLQCIALITRYVLLAG